MLIRAQFVRLKLTRTANEVKSHRSVKGATKATRVSAIPTIQVPWKYTPLLFWQENTEGNKPSSDIAAMTSGWGSVPRSTTSGSKESSPMDTSQLAHNKPCCSKAISKDVADMPVVNGTMATSAICASPEKTEAPSNVPISARGMLLEGFEALDAMQQTSSNPMKPKKSAAVAWKTPAAPWGAKVSIEENRLPVQHARPAMIMKATRNTLQRVNPLITTLPMSMPVAMMTVHNRVIPAAMGSK
mmetsp:Transcript_105960/g.297934  ORF Transcript_105960/g.297934 Transcript_105960/m.297934 type:complete len:243 (-) Transcript_105960:363-1091(-)